MNNNQNKGYKRLASIISSLTPLEFTLSGTIIAWIITLELTPNEQNSLGNWLEMVGQIMLTYSAQALPNLTPSEINDIYNDINNLKKEVERLKKANTN